MNCIVGSLTEPGCVTVPGVPPTPVAPHVVSHAAPLVQHVASLPFTGADFKELAVVGVAAVLAGLVLRFRRHSTPA